MLYGLLSFKAGSFALPALSPWSMLISFDKVHGFGGLGRQGSGCFRENLLHGLDKE